jgi:hypothetical protein
LHQNFAHSILHVHHAPRFWSHKYQSLSLSSPCHQLNRFPHHCCLYNVNSCNIVVLSFVYPSVTQNAFEYSITFGCLKFSHDIYCQLLSKVSFICEAFWLDMHAGDMKII